MNRYKESLRQYFSVQAKALRKKRKLTQEEMSEQLHITVRAYSDLERGSSISRRAHRPLFCSISVSENMGGFRIWMVANVCYWPTAARNFAG